MKLTNRGMRQGKQASAKESVRALETQISNLGMAVRLTQMVIKKLDEDNRLLTNKVEFLTNVINEVQYRTLGMLEAGTFDREKLEKIANDLKVLDYDKASAEDDKKRNLQQTDAISETSVVTITSTVNGSEDDGIFRSKISLQDLRANNEELRVSLIGKKVGDVVSATINDKQHEVTVLSIREAVEAEPAPIESQALEQDLNQPNTALN